MKRLLLTFLLLAIASNSAHATRLDSVEVETVNVNAAAPLTIVPVGAAPGRPWVKQLATFELPDQPNQWRHLFYIKKNGKNERASYPITLNLNTGEFKYHEKIVGLETWRTAWAGDTLYLAQNIPAHLIEYNPKTDTFTDHGHAFEKAATVFRISVGHDGRLALAGNHPAEATLYDPATKQFQKFGQLGTRNAYCYEIGQEEKYIYAATRGKGPWELYRIDKATGEIKLIDTRPTDGYINISGNHISTRQSRDDDWKRWVGRDGELHPFEPSTSRSSKAEARPRPTVMYEPQATYADGLFTIHYQSPTDLNTWKKARVAVPLGASSMVEAVSLPDGRIAAAAASYTPIVLLDPKSGESKLIPLERLSIRSMLLHGGNLLLTGYPGAAVHRYDLSRDATPTMPLPNRPAVKETDPSANPKLLARFPMTNRTGGHIGVGLFPARDGRVYLITRRHRHHRGFSLAWFDPKPTASGEFHSGIVDTGSAFDHLQIGGVSQTADDSKLLVSTYLEPNDQIEGSAPDAAKLFVFDLDTGQITKTFTPVEDAATLTGIVKVDDETAVGLATDLTKRTSLVYRIDLNSGSLLAARQYSRIIQGIPGVSSIPVKGGSFILGPDGNVWSSINISAGQCVIVRIDPQSLAIEPVGKEPSNGSSMLFHAGELYLTGSSQLRHVKLSKAVKDTFKAE